jgi:bifunctional non-homologous end joining protein LigD
MEEVWNQQSGRCQALTRDRILHERDTCSRSRSRKSSNGSCAAGERAGRRDGPDAVSSTVKPLPKIEPIELVQQGKPFDHDEWLFEVKHDGFRALAYIDNGPCRLIRCNDVDYKRFGELALALPSEVNVKNAILDGELVVLDRVGKAKFNDLMAGRGFVAFAAFDLMWLNGRDLRDLPLWQRKELLRFHLEPSNRVVFVDHIEGKGKRLFEQICLRDMAGIVCKPSFSPYRTIRGTTTWIAVKNPNYSQAEGRGELVNKRQQ